MAGISNGILHASGNNGGAVQILLDSITDIPGTDIINHSPEIPGGLPYSYKSGSGVTIQSNQARFPIGSTQIDFTLTSLSSFKWTLVLSPRQGAPSTNRSFISLRASDNAGDANRIQVNLDPQNGANTAISVQRKVGGSNTIVAQLLIPTTATPDNVEGTLEFEKTTGNRVYVRWISPDTNTYECFYDLLPGEIFDVTYFWPSVTSSTSSTTDWNNMEIV